MPHVPTTPFWLATCRQVLRSHTPAWCILDSDLRVLELGLRICNIMRRISAQQLWNRRSFVSATGSSKHLSVHFVAARFQLHVAGRTSYAEHVGTASCTKQVGDGQRVELAWPVTKKQHQGTCRSTTGELVVLSEQRCKNPKPR